MSMTPRPLTLTIVETVIPDTLGCKREEAHHLTTGYLSYAVQALNTLKKGALTQFDALAGDAACQTRALFICNLYESEKKEGFRETNELLQCLEELHKNLVIQQVASGPALPMAQGKKLAYIETIVPKTALKIHFRVAISAFILTKSRGTEDSSKTASIRLEGFPKELREDVCFQLKRSLSKDSVNMVQAIASDLLKKKFISKATLGLVKGDHVKESGRIFLIPTYFSLKTVLQGIKMSGHPLLLDTPQGYQLFSTKGSGKFEKEDREQLPQDKALVLIKGKIVTGSFESVCEDIEEACMMCAAHHYQYRKEEEELNIDYFHGDARIGLLSEILKKKNEGLSIEEATQAAIEAIVGESRSKKKQNALRHSTWGGQVAEEVAEEYILFEQHRQKARQLKIKHIYCSTLQEAVHGK